MMPGYHTTGSDPSDLDVLSNEKKGLLDKYATIWTEKFPA
jgi:hypothetical protein